MDDLPVIEFGFPGPLRDRLVAAVLAGTKTSTASLLRGYEVDREALPSVGDRGAVIDSNGTRVALVEITDVRVVRLADVDDAHAADEGEGYTDAAGWRVAHESFWTSAPVQHELGGHYPIDDDTAVVLERFRRITADAPRS